MIMFAQFLHQWIVDSVQVLRYTFQRVHSFIEGGTTPAQVQNHL